MEAPNETPVDNAPPAAPDADNAAPTAIPTPDAPVNNLVPIEALPEDLRGDKTLDVFKTGNDQAHINVDNLAKSYINARSMLGKDRITIPTTDDEWNEAYTKLGRPEKAEAYELPPVADDLNPAVKAGAEAKSEWWKSVAHKHGLNPKQAAGVYQDFVSDQNSDVVKMETDTSTQMELAERELKDEYGSGYNRVLTMTNRYISERGGEPLVEALERTGAGRDPVILKFIMQEAQDSSEDLGLNNLGEPLFTPESLQEQIREKQADTAYLDKADPRHAIVVNQVEKLYQQLHSVQ